MPEVTIRVIETKNIPVNKIKISNIQARQSQVTKGLDIFAEQIRKVGLIQPIVVYHEDDGYELVVGQRRYYAHKDVLHWDEIYAMIIEKPEDGMTATTISWLGNQAMQKMPNGDIVRHVANMYEEKLTIKEISNILGITQREVKNCINLPRVPDVVRDAVQNSEISAELAVSATDAKMFEKGITSEDQGADVLVLAKMINGNKLTDKQKQTLVEYAKNNPNADNDMLLSDGIQSTTETLHIDLTSSDMKRLERYTRNNDCRSKSSVATKLILDGLD